MFPQFQTPTGHAWVRVSYQGETRDIDPKYLDVATGQLSFKPLTLVRAYSGFFRLLAGWGSTAVNAYRYYRTGSDDAPK